MLLCYQHLVLIWYLKITHPFVMCRPRALSHGPYCPNFPPQRLGISPHCPHYGWLLSENSVLKLSWSPLVSETHPTVPTFMPLELPLLFGFLSHPSCVWRFSRPLWYIIIFSFSESLYNSAALSCNLALYREWPWMSLSFSFTYIIYPGMTKSNLRKGLL